jgi:hypothetical protein
VKTPIALAALALAIVVSGCGDGNQTPEERAAIPQAAFEPSKSEFPPVEGRTLQQIAGAVRPGPQVGLATSVFTPGENRVAFGLIDRDQSFLYGPTAVYFARRPSAEAKGPIPAPADSLVTAEAFRSRQAVVEEESAIAAIYSAELDLPAPGKWYVLVASLVDGKLRGGGTTIDVAGTSPVPEVGERAPVVTTETVASTPDKSLLETRDPPDDMHAVNFADVVGEKPVALLFATPALCESRVCGPVTDIAAELQAKYGDEVEFIHQEVYVDNDRTKGLREPLKRFGLPTEPWLFTVDADGRIAARLEGSFGAREFERAVQAARQ